MNIDTVDNNCSDLISAWFSAKCWDGSIEFAYRNIKESYLTRDIGPNALLTISGGFQVYLFSSLPQLCVCVDEEHCIDPIIKYRGGCVICPSHTN